MCAVQVIVIDELGTKEEVASARKLSQQGVSLIATAYAISLRNLINNPELNSLVGGTTCVTLGDKCAQYEMLQLQLRQIRPSCKVVLSRDAGWLSCCRSEHALT